MPFFSRKSSKSARRSVTLNPETLEDRSVPSVTAIFNSGNGILTVTGDNAANVINVGADDAGNLTVTNTVNNTKQAIVIDVVGDGVATRDNTELIKIDGKKGNDSLTTDKSLNTVTPNTPFTVKAPRVDMLGGAGNDTLVVNSGGFGSVTSDVNGVLFVDDVVGHAFMDGGAGNDSLSSGFGNDTMLGGTGNDSYLWPPGTLTDFWDGGAGNDTATIKGNENAGDIFSLTAGDHGQARFQRTSIVFFQVDMANTENIVLLPGTGDDSVFIGELSGVASLRQVMVDVGGGDDLVDASLQMNRRISLDLDGGTGMDTLKGGAGRDTLRGGDGDDDLNGGAGRDLLLGGNDNDTLDGGDDRDPDRLMGGTGGDTFVNRSEDSFTDFQAKEGDSLEQPM